MSQELRSADELKKVWKLVQNAIEKKFADRDVHCIEAMNAIDVAIGWVLMDEECTRLMDDSISALEKHLPCLSGSQT